MDLDFFIAGVKTLRTRVFPFLDGIDNISPWVEDDDAVLLLVVIVPLLDVIVDVDDSS